MNTSCAVMSIEELVEDLIEKGLITVDEWDAFDNPVPLFSDKASCLLTEAVIEKHPALKNSILENAFDQWQAEIKPMIFSANISFFSAEAKRQHYANLGEFIYQKTLLEAKDTVIPEILYDEIDQRHLEKLLAEKYPQEYSTDLPIEQEYLSATAHNRG